MLVISPHSLRASKIMIGSCTRVGKYLSKLCVVQECPKLVRTIQIVRIIINKEIQSLGFNTHYLQIGKEIIIICQK